MVAKGVRNVAVVTAHSMATADGIRDYSERLVANLQQRSNIRAGLFRREYRPFATRLEPVEPSPLTDCAAADAIIVQYNPFWYGRRGFAPGLPMGLLRLRRAAPSATIALMVHETFVDRKNVKWALMSSWQRTQLRALQRLVDVQLCSIETWTEALGSAMPGVPVWHLPVPSNFPDRRVARARVRSQLGASDESVILATFGLHHPGRLTDRMLAAARAIGAQGRPTFLLNLGTGDRSHAVLDGDVTLIAPGFLDAERAAEALSAADVYMAAFADGVSTRRGTLMAALQHQIAVVGTDGHLTDTLLKDAAGSLRLEPVDRPERFVEAVVDVAADPGLRLRLSQSGRRLYESKFDWPVVVSSLLRILNL